jgi:uncharacterized LabA/DUF88 family protein
MRLGVFVDIHNQVTAIQEQVKAHRVNYHKYLQLAQDIDDQFVVAIAYVTQASDEFIHVLKKLGYIPKFNQLNKNVEMTIDILNLATKLDTIVIGSNSPDLIPLIHHLQMQGIRVGIISPGPLHTEGNYSIDLLTEGTVIEYIQDIRGHN